MLSSESQKQAGNIETSKQSIPEDMAPNFAFLTSSIPAEFRQCHSHISLTTRRPRRTYTTSFPRRARVLRAATQDYYQTLDIPESADAQTIKRAYRRAALKNHPDVSDAPDARERFLRVQEAYAVLSDPTRRGAYDRRRRAGSYSSDGSNFPGFDFDSAFDTAEFAKKWRDVNPMPNDINDSFGNIFGDFFSGVADAVNTGTSASGGVAEDFVDFLEKRVDGFSSKSSSRKSSEEDFDDDILRSDDEDILNAEIEDARFILRQLRQRKQKVQREEDNLNDRVRQWRDRADRADSIRDYDTRDAARDRETDLRAEARRFARRVDQTSSHIRKQEKRLTRIEKRLKEVQHPASQRSQSDERDHPATQGLKTPASSRNGQPSAAPNKEKAIDDELERMKRELGL